MAMLGESMQAHHDRLALAVTDSPQLVTSTGCVDASHDLEIGPCTTQTRLLVVAGFAMTLLSATLASGWWNAFGDYDTTVGSAGVVAFALMTVRLIWMLPAERGSVVILTPYGIRDLRIGNEFLLWDSIAEISAWPVVRRTIGRATGSSSGRRVWRPILTHCCALAATVTPPAVHAPHCSRKMNAAPKASPYKRHKIAVRRRL